jgi:IS30 family transposase
VRILDLEVGESPDLCEPISAKKGVHTLKKYSQLSQEERYTLSTFLAKGYSIPQIAKELGRHPSTLYREKKRNLRPSGQYAAFVAHSYAVARNHRCHRGSHFIQEEWTQVENLLKLQWSPQQISHRLAQSGKLSISVPTIYRRIKKDRRRGGELFKDLRIVPKRRRKRYRTEDYIGRLKGKLGISDRPASCSDRSEFGHWEGDTVMGSNKFECVVTLVERKTGLAKIAKVLHRTARQTNAAIGRIISAEPHLFKTITFDNGTEFHSYKRLEKRFGITCYFAAPHHPWERGSNENFNGLLRQYLPKGARMDYLGDRKLDKICHRINERPRKRLAYKSPQEVLCELLAILLG